MPDNALLMTDGGCGIQLVPPWQPIETAPRGEYVLMVYPPDGVNHLTAKYDVGVVTAGFGIANWSWSMKPTHWMALPEPPKSE